MKRILICVLLSVCFQSYGGAQQRTAGIPDIDARRAMDELKKMDTGGMFRQREARPITPQTGRVLRPVEVGNKSNARPVISGGTERPRQVEEKREGEFFRPVIPNPQPPQPARAEARAAISQSGMVRYSLEQEQPYVQAEPSLYLENGCIARTFYSHIEHHPLMIEVKLQPNEALSYYPGEGEKIQLENVEGVVKPTAGIYYSWKGRQVFLQFGSICGLDGKKEVALCYKSRQLEVTVKRAKIVTLDVPTPKKNK